MKRVFPESSSSFVDPDVVEISPPLNWSSKSKSRSKRKEAAHHEVINIDPDDHPDIIMLDDNEDDGSSYKGKQSANASYNNMATVKATDTAQNFKSTTFQVSHDSIDVGFLDHDFVCDDAYMDLFQDGSIFDDEYALLQSQFDGIDIPSGIEAPVPWFKHPSENKKKVDYVSSSSYPIPKVQLDSSGAGSSHSRGRNWNSPSSSSSAKQSYISRFSPFPAFPESSPYNNKLDASITLSNFGLKTSTGSSSLSSKLPRYPPEFSSSEKKYNVSANNGLGSVKLLSRWDSYNKGSHPKYVQNKILGKDKLTLSSPGFNTSKVSHALKSMEMGYFSSYQPPPDQIFKEAYDDFLLSPEENLDINGAVNPAQVSTAPSGSMSSTKDYGNLDDIMKKFQVTKQFDTVEDYSDHYYATKGSSETQQTKKWAKAIQEEWRILEKDLPDTIFVRVYESRMDLLRAVIVGAQGTPYHDGLFFFDIFFPSRYPSTPPHVHYHSGGLRINPNLYNCGKVCLSLLNTWTGSGKEKWIPNVSTMLQVLVSIQALVLNEKPYFNEPGYAHSAASAAGQQNSNNYSERTFILSLKTMVYTMRKPPKHFEEFVIGHFCKHAQDILGACKMYIEEGVHARSVTKGEVKNAQANTHKCSPNFISDVASHITMLVEAFVRIGAKDCDKFLSLAKSFNAGVNRPNTISNGISPWLQTEIPAYPTHKSKYKKYYQGK